jgi:hypothetical protein
VRKASSIAVPSLDELAADWMDAKTLCNRPAVHNFWGGLKTTGNLMAFEFLTFPPYSQGGWSGEAVVDGTPVAAEQSRWYPHQVMRRAVRDGVTLESSIRLPFEQQGVLCRLVICNTTARRSDLTLGLQLHGRVRRFAEALWNTWDSPRARDDRFVALTTSDRQTVVVADKSSPAAIAFAFVHAPDQLRAAGEQATAEWNLSLTPGATLTIEYTAAVDKDAQTATESAKHWAKTFEQSFAQAKPRWEERWQAAFTPGNQHFSGHLPTLLTGDTKIHRVYYEGALTSQLLCRTNLPVSKRVFVTAGPQWATTLMYFWDTEMWANSWAMLEPVAMKEHLIKWLAMDIHRCYALDYMSGRGAGPWYAANDWSVFRCVEAYLDVTGDNEFLKQKVAGKTVLEHLVRFATAYVQSSPKDGLADYGDNGNLLECAPAYIHRVPSLNAANVYMVRRVARYLNMAGEKARAADLCAQADKVLTAVLSLYTHGDGTWNALHLDAQKVPLRHCFDYIIIGQALENDLTPKVKSEMNTFVENELRTETWMRAMSLKDRSAANSDRPDHGPMGSYDGWPPLTMDVMCRFGAFCAAVNFLRSTEAVTHEGPFAQSHEFLGANSRGRNPLVRIAYRGGQDFNEGCGMAFVNTVIRSFFGYRPDLSGSGLPLLASTMPRGFSGKLLHVPHHGKLYTITNDTDGVHATRED